MPKFKLLSLLILIGVLKLSISIPTSEDNTIEDETYNFRIAYAAQMLSYMNLSVQPCDDFYEYACGNWKNTIQKRYTLRQRVNLEDIEFQLSDAVEHMLQRANILDIAPDLETEFQKAKKFYQNCLNSELYPLRKSKYFLETLQSIGGFPAVDSGWNSSRFSWLNMTAHLSNYGIDGLLKEKIIPMYPYTPMFFMPTFGFDMKLHYDTINNSSSNAYQVNQKQMQNILSTYEVDKDKSEKVITDIFIFLKDVLDMVAQFDELYEKCVKLSTSIEINEMKKDFVPYFDIAWMAKFSELPDDNMPCIYYYQELSKICEQHKEAVANYMSVKFLSHMDVRLENEEFQKDYCTKEIWNGFFSLFDHLYMKLHFNSDIADDIKSMYKSIFQSLHELIETANWLDETTREAALLKAASVKVNVGRYEHTYIDKVFLAELNKIMFVEDNYERNIMMLKKFNVYMGRYYGLHQEELDNEIRPMDSTKAMTVNAFFDLKDNTIYVAAGAMLPPIYHKYWPHSLKWGTMGYTLGHEFGHGFNNFGRLYDHEGQWKNWWSVNASKIFEERVQCYIDHYSNYSMPKINRNVNGQKTNHENVADATGLVTAYMAYKRYMNEENKMSEPLAVTEKYDQMPGFNLSPDQLFFLGAAQMWCSDYKEAHYWTKYSDPHTLEKYRVNGMLSNNRDFVKAFNCSLGDNMNLSKEKCRLW